MKKFSVIALAAMFVIAMGIGSAFAEITYNVTAGFGKEVQQDGLSELVGQISFQPVLDIAYAGDAWFGGLINYGTTTNGDQIIRANILAGATISRTFGAVYRWDGTNIQPLLVGIYTPTAYNDRVTDASRLTNEAGVSLGLVTPGVGVDNVVDSADYIVVAYKGMDHFRIYVINPDKSFAPAHRAAYAAGVHPLIRVNHDNASALCFKLLGSQYRADSLAYEMVQVSYVDEYYDAAAVLRKNSYSGDQYVATVRNVPLIFSLCGKAMPKHTIREDGLCSSQEECGECSADDCIFTFQTTSTFKTGQYRMVLGKTTGAKLGVGFYGVELIHSVNGSLGVITLPPAGAGLDGVIERRDRNGGITTLSARTSQITFDVTLPWDTGSYQVVAYYVYDTCVPITPGYWTVDFYAYPLPCGNSFGFSDRDIINFVDPLGKATCQIFPYAAASLDGRWHNGLVLTNPMSVPVTVAVKLVEEDGAAYGATVTIPANEMIIGMVGDLLEPVLASGSTDAAFGDESYAMYASANGTFYGFLFVTNGHVAQGYVPLSNLCCAGIACSP